MLVYCQNINSRLKYICDFISKEIFDQAIELTSDSETFRLNPGPKINYSHGKISENEFWLQPHGLLSEEGINPQTIDCFLINNNKVFFKTSGDFPFDIFAACFYLISRYEEYLPHKKDIYGRYAHENSIAFRENFLNLPLINIWLEDLKKALFHKFSTGPDLSVNLSTFNFQPSTFNFQPTYDIDIAYSYEHKGMLRNLGGAFRSIRTGNWKMVKERFQVLQNKRQDPFDSYDLMDRLNEKYSLAPIYFFNVASKLSRHDKNISPHNTGMTRLIRHHANRYKIGVHPSWSSGDDASLIKKEIETLEKIINDKITSSRQHFIRFTLPNTFRELIRAGILYDYSMGYGSINGFRASVASPFYWYDLGREEQTSLLLYPFCYMDANSFFEQKFSPEQALEELRNYYSVIRSVNGLMVTIWHNPFFGTDELFRGWKEVFSEWVEEIKF